MHRLTDQVTLFGNRYFNHYLVGNPIAVLIEAGVSGSVANLKAQWPALRCSMEEPEVRYLLAMHGHFDHVCGLPSLKAFFPQAEVLASPEAEKVLMRPKIIADFFAQDAKMTEVLLAEGIVPARIQPPTLESIKVDQTVGSEDQVNLAKGAHLRILAAPGHSPCSIAAYLPQDQVMFVSDAAGFQINESELFPIFFYHYEQYVETLRRLRSFPTRVLAMAHGPFVSEPHMETFYDRALDTAASLFNEIERKLDQGGDEADLKQELFARYYRERLRIYTPENIMLCVELLIRRVKECL